MSNVFNDVIFDIEAEQFTELLSRPGIRIERIISSGQTTPGNEWFDQDWTEWVLLLKGSAQIRFEDEAEVKSLRVGDCLEIKPHMRHRVEHTDIGTPTVWLAVHFGNGVGG